MHLWPLNTPPQIVGDSKVIAATTNWGNTTRPTRADGSKANLLLIAWDGSADLNVRSENSGEGPWFPVEAQPVLLSFIGDAASIYARVETGTADVHITPVEAS